MIEVVQGEIDRSIKDSNGNPLSEEALLHFSGYRVRCNSCEKNFYTACSLSPYHLGMTCEQYKQSLIVDRCRFCSVVMKEPSISDQPAFKLVCRDINCIALTEKMCNKVLPCTHACNGCANEPACLPCLHPQCVKLNEIATLSADSEQYCSVCFTDSLAYGPCIQFKCKHIFHLDCIQSKIAKKWEGSAHIKLSYMECPACSQILEGAEAHAPLNEMVKAGKRLHDIIKVKAVERAKLEGLEQHERIVREDSDFFNKLEAFALYKLQFYECHQCKLPYYGGQQDCGEAIR